MGTTDNTDDAIKQSNRILKGLDKISDKLEKESDKIKDVAIDEAIKLNNVKTPLRASSLVASKVDSKLDKVIKNTEKDFNDFIKEVERYLLANFAIKLSKKNLEVISRKGSEVLEALVDNNDKLKADVQAMLTQNLAKGVPQRQLVKELKDLYPAYSRNAKTLLNTGLSRLFIDINITKFRESNFKWYVWAGPDDSITREKPCKHWVWHRFPQSQLSTITAARMRLWNCRHSIIPIPEEEIDNYPIGDIKLA